MRGLLVDYGGVLTTNVFESFREFCVSERLEPNAVKELFRNDSEALALLRRLERGEFAAEDFSPLFAERLGVSDSEDLVPRLFAGLRPDERMLGAVRDARTAGIRTGVVSNSWGPSIYDGQPLEELFDAVVISGEVGMHKPQPEIFLLASERLGVDAPDCVFVDDLRENCAGAEEVGMTAILHRGADKTLPELERLLGVALG